MKTNYISKVNFYNLKLKKIKNFFNFKLYSNQFKTNTLKLIVKNLSFKTKNSQFSINQVSTKKLNLFYNKSFVKKKLKRSKNNIYSNKFFIINYYFYLIKLNGILSLQPYSYFTNLISRFKLIFKEYYFLFKLKKRKKKKKLLNYDNAYLLNLLKVKQKFQYITNDLLKMSFIYFKYTGSNMYGTITNSLGEVLYSYSAGIFKNIKTRKEKTTIFIAKQLGELIALRLFKSNALEIIFIPFMNHRKARSLIKFLSYGFRLIRFFKLSKFIINRRVMRNGVRLRKIARK